MRVERIVTVYRCQGDGLSSETGLCTKNNDKKVGGWTVGGKKERRRAKMMQR